MIYTSSEVELIKSRILPSEIIVKKVQLKNKREQCYTGLCPFHKEKTPSFFVNDYKRFYHCFGCGAHGDIISFIMQDEGATYQDTLEKLAQIAGIKPSKSNTEELQRLKKNEIFFQIYKKTSEFYQEQLFNNIGYDALQYILSRGIRLETIKQYNIGFAPTKPYMMISLLMKEFNEDCLLKSGVIKKKHNFVYDPFYGRIIFPIKDKYGKCIGFGGRVLEKKEPKYLNSAESPIFTKSKHLYGYHDAKNVIHKTQEALVVEGYMDVISLASHGITNAIAPLGTNIKLNQIHIVWDICQEATICFDNDQAGEDATKRIAYESLEDISYNKSLKFVQLTDGKDPDEIVQKKGVDFLKNLISKSTPLSDYIFNIELEKYDLNIPEKKLALQISLEKILQKILNNSLKKNYAQHFKNKFYKITYQSTITKDVKNTKQYYSELLQGIKEKDYHHKNIFILNILYSYPELLNDNQITEELININLPNKLDKFRKILLEFHLSVKTDLSLFLKSNILNTPKEEKQKQEIIELIAFAKFKSQTEAKEHLLKIFNIKRLTIIKEEIKQLKNQLLLTVNDNLMKKMLYLKKYEKQLKDKVTY